MGDKTNGTGMTPVADAISVLMPTSATVVHLAGVLSASGTTTAPLGGHDIPLLTA